MYYQMMHFLLDRSDENSAGFTIVELVAVMALGSIMLALGVFTFGHYARVQTLEAGTDEMVAQLRRLQQQVVSEGHPLVHGARFTPGSDTWALVRYNPADGTCLVQPRDLTSGMFSTDLRISATTFPQTTSPEETACRAAGTGATSNDRFLFFYSRGTATVGSVTLFQPALARSETVSVTGITGRVRRT